MFESKVMTRDGFEPVVALEISDKERIFLNYDNDYFVKASNPKKPKLLKFPIFLDTETSHNHNEDDPVAWVYQFAMKFGSLYLVGRKPSDLIEWLDFIADGMGLNESNKIVIYVHNLSYDMQYLKNYLIEHYETFNVLALKSHKILQVETDFFVFKCTYLLSNRSLDAWVNALNVNHIKATGTIDYDLIRYQDDTLSDNDWRYQLSDVASMADCFEKECNDQFNVQTIPLTSTGFVRFDGRQEFRKDPKNRKLFQKQRLNERLYKISRDAFMGGYTHGNRNYRGVRIDAKVGHGDFRSFYPSTTRVDYFPHGEFGLYYRRKQGRKYPKEELQNALNNYCCIITVAFTNGELNPEVTAPILSESKVFANRLGTMTKESDNGRILTFTGTTVLHLTELDYKWIVEQYNFEDIEILEMYTAERRPLPEWFTRLTDKYFHNKTNLKNIDEFEYMKSKNKLNSIYGMTATDICREEWKLNTKTGEWSHEQPDIDTALKKYYKSRNNFMSYQYGLYVTAHCRDRLLTMIKNVIGYENFLYADTDSAFYIWNEEIEKRINDYNADNMAKCLDIGAYIHDNDGNVVEYMVFEDEKDEITSFKFLHAKCYGMISHGKLKITVAGVTSKQRTDKTKTREDELQSLDNLENGFIFRECGGTTSFYTECEPRTELVNGHTIEYSSACIIRDVEYTIKDYRTTWVKDVNAL